MHYAAENLHWSFYRTSEKIAMTSEICNNEEEKEEGEKR